MAAAIGAVSALIVALASAALTGRMAANRERERLRSEERRERDRQEAQAGSEREARLFEHRRLAIEKVVSSFSRYREAAEEAEMGGPYQGEEAANDMNEQLTAVRTYCTTRTREAAERLHQALVDEEFGEQPDSVEPYQAFKDFLAAAQADLGAMP